MSTGRRKKSKLKRSQSRDRYGNDPAYTDDVRHLAMPLRRNSGPEISSRGLSAADTFFKMDLSSSGGGNHSEPFRVKKSKKRRGIYEKIGHYMTTTTAPSKSNYDECRMYENSRSLKNICMDSSSEDGLLEEASSRYRRRAERGQSLDYGQIEKKSWFTRESRSTEHTLARPLKEAKRKHHTLDRTEKYVIEHLRNKLKGSGLTYSTAYSASQEWDPEESRQFLESHGYGTRDEHSNRLRYLGSGRSADDLLSQVQEGTKSKESGRFKIGKRFLRGEIGIKSFNYYLIKEGLKTAPTTSSSSSKKAAAASKQGQMKTPKDEKKFDDRRQYKDISAPPGLDGWAARKAAKTVSGEENIYEEIFFRDKDLRRAKADTVTKYNRPSYGTTGVATTTTRASRRGEVGDWKFRDDCELCTQQEQCANENCDICKKNNCAKKRPDTKIAKSSNPRMRPTTLDFNTDGEDEDEDEGAIYARISGNRGGVVVNKYAEMGSHYSRIVHPSQGKGAAGVDGGNKALPEQQPQQQQPVLQFQSYNPNTGVFKMEATPIAVTNHFNPFEAKLVESYQPPVTPQPRNSIYQELRQSEVTLGKSSSSSDSLTQSRKQSKRATSTASGDHSQRHEPMEGEGHYSRPRIGGGGGSLRRTGKAQSDGSMFSEEAFAGRFGGRKLLAGPGACGELSDSSIGDSLFSCSNQRRCFGSTESCRLGSDCQRCLERCNYYSEDNTNYCRHCDCSSSYFSSDFDENPIGGGGGIGGLGGGNGPFKRNMNSRVSVQSNPATTSSVSQQPSHDNYYDYPKQKNKCEPTTGYGEEFMRHVINVKNTTSMCASAEEPTTTSSHYSKPKSNAAEHSKTGRCVAAGRDENAKVTTKEEIRNRETAPVATTTTTTTKRSVRKKYYYDDIMTIPNEVAYNLSYGMIRRDTRSKGAPEVDKQKEIIKTACTENEIATGFQIYEEIKERPRDLAADPKEPFYATISTRPKEEVRETGTKPKTMPVYEEIPMMQMKKTSQPIYASPVKVKRITPNTLAEQISMNEGTLKLGTDFGSKWTDKREKSNSDTSLRVEGKMENEEEMNRKNGPEWTKCTSNQEEKVSQSDAKVDKPKLEGLSNQEIGGHCEMPRPTKEQVVLDVAADPADEMNTSSGKALGVSSGVSRDIEALSSTAGFPPPADAADEQKQIIQTHNHDEDEKNINLKSLKESLLVQETTQRPLGNLAARAGAGAGTAEQTRDETHGNGAKEKSTVAKAEKSFVSCKSPAREPTSGGRQMTAKEKPRETKSVEKTNIPVVFQRETVVIEERAKALEFNAAAVAELSQLPAPVSVELSKRSVEGSACSRKDDEEEVGGAAGGNALIGVESITSKTEEKW